MRSKDLRAQRAKLVVDARALIDKDGPSNEEVAKFHAMLAEAETLKTQIDALERADALNAELVTALGAPANGGGSYMPNFDAVARDHRIALARVSGNFHALAPADVAHYEATTGRDKRIMTAILRNRMGALSPEDQAHAAGRIQAAASEGSNSGGGYTVAPLFMRELLIAMKAYGGMRQAARSIQTDTGAVLPWPTMDDTANAATIISENTSVSTDTDLAFGQVSINAYTWKSGALLVSLQLMQDSAFDFDKVIRDAIAIRFARAQNAMFTNGTGTGQPQGVTVGAPVGIPGATGTTVSTSFDYLQELMHSVDPAYRPGARWMFHDLTLQFLSTLKDSYGRYLWMPGASSGAPDLIWGYPYTINQAMPVMAANAVSILFGNFDHYLIRDVLDMQMMVLRERYADYLQVGYIAFTRTDGRLVTAGAPIKSFVNSAT